MVYLTNEDWNKIFIPKLNNDILFIEELKQEKKINDILLKLIKLIFPNKNDSENELEQHIIYSSMVYYYKYILKNNIPHSDLSELKKVLICTASIFLAFKAEGKRIELDLISQALLPLLNNKSANIKLIEENLKNLITQYEYDILCAIQFNLGIDNPYDILKNLKFYLKKISIESNIINEIIQLINKYINESLLFPLCLYFSSYDIVLSCIFLVKESHNYYFINIDKFIQIYQLTVDKNDIYQCSKYISKILNILKKNREIPEDNQEKEIKNNTKDNNKIIINSNDIPQDDIENEIDFDLISNINSNLA